MVRQGRAVSHGEQGDDYQQPPAGGPHCARPDSAEAEKGVVERSK